MRFDTVIMGGGLAGLTAGIALARRGTKVAIVTSGQSALHFNSGSMELLGYDAAHRSVEHPLEAMRDLDATHPYKVMGLEAVEALLPQVKPFFSDAGIRLYGSHEYNHWRLSPVGVFKPAWLTIDDYVRFDNPASLPWRRVALVGLKGFVDFFPAFLANGLAKRGVKSITLEVTTEALEQLRKSTTEMRAANIARVVQSNAGIDAIALAINKALEGHTDIDAVLFPAVVGFDDCGAARRLRDMVRVPLEYIATMGTAVPGVRTQLQLIKHFRTIGGHYLGGDSIRAARFDGNRLQSLTTANMADDRLEADNFIFAAGSFFSHGLKANPDGIVEPVLGLDVEAPHRRAEWFDKDIFRPQPYMKYGVGVDGPQLRAMHGGRPVDNLRVIGSSLPGADSLTEGSGAGVAILTALHAANLITSAK